MSERVSRFVASGRWLLCGSMLALLGCPKQELAPLGPCTVSAAARRVDQSGISKVDLLFVIDNSGSMATEQLKIAAELPRLVQVLTTGDRNAGRPAGAAPTPGQMFTAVSSLHLGVVSTNMGGIDNPMGESAGALSCKGLGDDGKLLQSTEVAVAGVMANTNVEFPGYRQGEAVLPADPDCQAVGRPPKYQVFEAGKDPSAEQVATAFRCVSKLGVRGCSYEQQLEAMWKAVAPSDGKDKFLGGTKGHGDPKGVNAGFVREDAILAIIHVSDEEDCSIKEEGKELFAQTPEAEQKFGPEVNLRCGRFGEQQGLVWPVERYIEGLRSLKPDHPDRVIFAGIVGIPVRANGMPFEQILTLPEMMFRPAFGGQPTPSCSNRSSGRPEDAYPPRRFVQVAQGFGTEAVIYSICADNYAPALDTLIDRIATKLSGNCLPRKLKRDNTGQVQCDVYELLPLGETKCVEARGHTGKPIKRTLARSGEDESRIACKMKQVPVRNRTVDADDKGWYYDDFTDQVQNVCPEGEQQRILFSFGELPEGASATFECLQPITSIDPTAKGFEAIHSLCAGGNDCRGRSDEDYELSCIDGSCQVTCRADPDCPPGWVCGAGTGAAQGMMYCQQPTCPPDESTSTESNSSTAGEPAPTGRSDAGRGRTR